MNNDTQLMQNVVLDYTHQGWVVIQQTPDNVQLKYPKRWNSTLLILGTVLFLLFGVGLIFLVLALFDYLFQSEPVIYINAAAIRAGALPKPRKSNTLLLLGIGGFFSALISLCAILIMFS